SMVSGREYHTNWGFGVSCSTRFPSGPAPTQFPAARGSRVGSFLEPRFSNIRKDIVWLQLPQLVLLPEAEQFALGCLHGSPTTSQAFKSRSRPSPNVSAIRPALLVATFCNSARNRNSCSLTQSLSTHSPCPQGLSRLNKAVDR